MFMNRRLFVTAAAALPLAGGRAAADRSPAGFRIGAITDTHVADEADAPPLLYRRSPGKIAAAVAEFNKQDLAFAVHLGDVVDKDLASFETALAPMRQSRHPWRFVLGNHDFNVADDRKAALPSVLGMPGRYYDFVYGGWRFVVLDGGDLSLFGWPSGSPEQARSRAAQAGYPNAKPWNGAIGPRQLAWLDGILREADRTGTPVALLCHFPICSQTDEFILLWNAAEVVAAIEPHPSVKLWLDGHRHAGGYVAKSGIHCLNLKAAVETEDNAFATIDFLSDRLVVHGYGREVDRTLILR